MIESSDLLSSLREQLPKVLGLGILVLVLTGDLVFGLLQVVPAVRVHAQLASQLDATTQVLDAPTGDSGIEATLKAKLAKMQTGLDAQTGAFLAASDVPVILNHLYRYADQASVQITKIESASASGPDASKAVGYEVQTFQVEVSGSAVQLIDFTARLQEAALPAVVIDNFVIKSGKTPQAASSLTMNLHLYTTPSAKAKISTTSLP
jgi:hypothetical protein